MQPEQERKDRKEQLDDSVKKLAPPKTVPVDVMRSGVIKPIHRIVHPYTHGSNWTPTIKFHWELPLFIASQLNRQFVHEIDPESPSFFYRTKAETLHLSRYEKNGTLTLLRYNLFEHRLVMEIPVCGGGDQAPEIHSTLPLFLPSGTCPVPGALVEFNQTRNLVDWYFKMRLLQEPHIWLDLKGYVADGNRHFSEYLEGKPTHFFLTGIADFVILNPSEECQFDILPQKESQKTYQLGKEEFQGILTAPELPDFKPNPNQHSDIHGIIVKVEDYNDKRLYLNHPAGGKVWGLTLKISSEKVEGPKIEILCLRHVVSHQKHRTPQDKNNPTYEDSVVPPKVGDSVYAKALIQAYSAHDPLNLPITSDNKPRVFRNMCSISKKETGKEKSQKEAADEPDDLVFQSKQTINGDPNRFFLYGKAIFPRLLPALFSSPLLAYYNSKIVGYQWHFPSLTKRERWAKNEDDQGIDVANCSLLGEFLAKAKKPPTAEPLCESSPETHCSRSKPDPRLLSNLNPQIPEPKERQELNISTYKNPFNMVFECLSLRQALLYARTSKTSYQLIKQNYLYWLTRFKKLNLGAHIHFPDANNPKSLPGLRQWVKVLYLQQALAFYKRQLDLDLVTADKLIEPFQKESREALTTQFRSRTHVCGLCNGSVRYGEHLDMNLGKVVDVIQMACKSCRDTKLWKPEQACSLWGIPKNQLNEIRAWKTAKLVEGGILNEFWYTKEDLDHYSAQMHAQHSKPST